MKKLLLIFLSALAINAFSQSGASTAKLQSAGNATLVSIKQDMDSLVNATKYTILSTTIVSTNNGTLTTANRYVGVGVYTMSLPSGNWVCLGGVLTASVLSTSVSLKFYCFGGTENIAGGADAVVVDVTPAESVNYRGIWYATTATYNYANGVGIYQIVTQNLTPQNQEFYTNNFIIKAVYGGGFTPNANQQYICRFYFKRVN